jgi:hypothetical protein
LSYRERIPTDPPAGVNCATCKVAIAEAVVRYRRHGAQRPRSYHFLCKSCLEVGFSARVIQKSIEKLRSDGEWIDRVFYIATAERVFSYLEELAPGARGVLLSGGNDGIFGAKQTIESAEHDRACPECGSIAKAGSSLIVHRPSCSSEMSLQKVV